jgi:DNA-binding SARP family transcriptional activator
MTALFLFGYPRLIQNNERIPVQRKKAFGLLSYLAVHQRGFSRENLIMMFWPDSEESRARANLRKILSDLHRMLGLDVLPVDGAMVDPLNEENHRALMRLFLMSGEREAARIQYRLCEEMLEKELGVQPDQDTLDLFEKTRGTTAAKPAIMPDRDSGVFGKDAPLVPTFDVVRVIRSEKMISNYDTGSSQLRARNLCMMGDFT